VTIVGMFWLADNEKCAHLEVVKAVDPSPRAG